MISGDEMDSVSEEDDSTSDPDDREDESLPESERITVGLENLNDVCEPLSWFKEIRGDEV